jgi:integrase
MATIRQRGNKFQVKWSEPKRDAYGVPTGEYKQCGETFATEEEAKFRQSQVEAALACQRLDPGTQRDLAKATLGQYATDFFDSLAGTIDPTTAVKYRANYLLYVAPTLGHRPVASIRVADVKKLRSNLASTVSKRTGRPLSAGTIKHAISVLRMILDTAVENEALLSNPAAVKLPSLRRQRDFAEGKPYTRLTVEQVATVASWIASQHQFTVTPKNRKPYTAVKPANPVYALAVLFSVATGVRASELQGLEVGDLTLSEHPGTSGLVSVRRKKRAANSWEAEPLKTANAYRDVPIDPWLADDLQAYLLHQHQADRLPNGEPNPRAPLFPGRLSKAAAQQQGRKAADSADRFDWTRPIDEQNVYKRFWLPALAALGYSHSRWHDMRHGFAVVSLSGAGENVRDVSRWLGHAKISTTMDIYAQVLKTETGGKANPLPRPAALPTGNVVPLERKAR